MSMRVTSKLHLPLLQRPTHCSVAVLIRQLEETHTCGGQQPTRSRHVDLVVQNKVFAGAHFHG